MLILWWLHCGLTRQKAAEVAGVGRATVQRDLAAFREGGVDGLRQGDTKSRESDLCGVRRLDVQGPVSVLAAYRDLIRESFEKSPVCTLAEACERLYQRTGLR